MVRNRYKFSLSACFVLVAIISYCIGCGNDTHSGKTQDKPFAKDATSPATVSVTPEQPQENSNETDPATPTTESRIEDLQPDITPMPITTPSVALTKPPCANNPYYDSYEYLLASQELALKELLFIFGEEFITQNPRTIIEKYGEPMEKRPFKGEEWQNIDRVGIWQFPQGFEVSVGTMNDYPIVTDYIYFSRECELKMSTGIGIGSTKAEVLSAYGEMISPKLQTDTRTAIGIDVFFIFEYDVIQSIYFRTYDFDAERYFIPGD